MKFKALLLLFFTIISFARLNAQSDVLHVKLSYSTNNTSIKDILKEIERLTNTHFTYNSALFNENELVSISVTQKNLEDVLNILFLSAFEYKQIGNQILISPRKGAKQSAIEKPNNTSPQKSNSTKPQKTIYDTVQVFDTISVTIYDTTRIIIYDTITYIDSTDIIEKQQIAQRKSSTNLSFSVFSGTHISYPIFYNSTPDNYAVQLQKVEQNTIGNSKSFIISYQKQRYSYGIGLLSIDYNQKTDYTTKHYIDDGSVYYKDTLWFWNYNLLFEYYKFIPGSDTVLIPVYDSTYTYNIVENPKKEEINNHVTSTNTYRYIGIPLSIGYRYNFNYKFELQTSLIITPLFLISNNGSLPNNTFSSSISNKDIGFSPVTLLYSISWNGMYHINKYYSIHVKPSCSTIPKYTNVHKAHFQKANIVFSLELGVSYSIPYELF